MKMNKAEKNEWLRKADKLFTNEQRTKSNWILKLADAGVTQQQGLTIYKYAMKFKLFDKHYDPNLFTTYTLKKHILEEKDGK